MPWSVPLYSEQSEASMYRSSISPQIIRTEINYPERFKENSNAPIFLWELYVPYLYALNGNGILPPKAGTRERICLLNSAGSETILLNKSLKDLLPSLVKNYDQAENAGPEKSQRNSISKKISYF